MRPATMAADDEPRPRANGMRFLHTYASGGTGSPATSKAFLTPMQHKFVSSCGTWSAPSPEDSMLNALARDTVSSDHMSSAMPRQSNPGPRFADVAGTRTVTEVRLIAISSMTALRVRSCISRSYTFLIENKPSLVSASSAPTTTCGADPSSSPFPFVRTMGGGLASKSRSHIHDGLVPRRSRAARFAASHSAYASGPAALHAPTANETSARRRADGVSCRSRSTTRRATTPTTRSSASPSPT
mmetsp:Transcript_17981/g.72078  ORF Transcript_17981/g.72078 Transcript_17981/m.72078 type:complete len:243 (+) Transcript_17981:181-909(+)